MSGMCSSRAARGLSVPLPGSWQRSTTGPSTQWVFSFLGQFVHNSDQDDNIGLANGYVSTLLLLAGTCVFSLSFPLVSPIFLLYLLIKHAVDIQNLRLFYTAREHQPMLLRTAVQVAMVCPVLAQVNIAIYHITNNVYLWSQSRDAGEGFKGDSPATLWSSSLLIVNSTMLLVAQVAFTTSSPANMF